jgi:LemA protein
MDIGTFIFLGVTLVAGVYFINIYNNLVRIKHNVSQAWSNIDILLKQRHDELPKLVEVCKQYMQYEGSALEKIIAARSGVSKALEAGDLGALGVAEGQLRLGLGNLFAVAEAYPELKANENFQHLESRITSLENAIADRREYYNDSVNINNVRIEQIPDIIVARLLNFKGQSLLEFEKEEIRDVDMKSLFS